MTISAKDGQPTEIARPSSGNAHAQGSLEPVGRRRRRSGRQNQDRAQDWRLHDTIPCPQSRSQTTPCSAIRISSRSWPRSATAASRGTARTTSTATSWACRTTRARGGTRGRRRARGRAVVLLRRPGRGLRRQLEQQSAGAASSPPRAFDRPDRRRHRRGDRQLRQHQQQLVPERSTATTTATTTARASGRLTAAGIQPGGELGRPARRQPVHRPVPGDQGPDRARATRSRCSASRPSTSWTGAARTRRPERPVPGHDIRPRQPRRRARSRCRAPRRRDHRRLRRDGRVRAGPRRPERHLRRGPADALPGHARPLICR